MVDLELLNYRLNKYKESLDVADYTKNFAEVKVLTQYMVKLSLNVISIRKYLNSTIKKKPRYWDTDEGTEGDGANNDKVKKELSLRR